MFIKWKTSRDVVRKKAVAVIVAAGSGDRLTRSLKDNDSEPGSAPIIGQGKALVDVLGVPMITHSVRAFEAATSISEIVIVAREIDVLGIYDIVSKISSAKVTNIVPGGATRQESVRRGLIACGDADIVAIHDCARPCIRSEKIDEIVKFVEATGRCATLATKVTDTLKRVRGGEITELVAREDLWQMQTPQVFFKEKLLKAHEKAIEDGFSVTDDTTLVQNYGERVWVIESDMENIKITEKADLYMSERILSSRTEDE